MQSRRNFMKHSAMAAVALGAGGRAIGQTVSKDEPMETHGQKKAGFFDISLAQWSLHKTLLDGKLKNIDFPSYTQELFDIHALEYVNTFFPSADGDYAKKLKQRTDDLGMHNVLIMIDGEGNLGEQDEAARKKSVENHYKWVECAHILGCHSIRVNAGGRGSEEEVAWAATKSLGELSGFAADYGINVIVENHGGYSSRASWLASVISNVGMVNCGTLPDFGNFRVSDEENYNIYLGTKELMPYAKGVSAKSHNFNAAGDEADKDYYRLLQIVKDAGYRGFIGIEYEGSKLSEDEGVMATKKLLIKAGKSL